MFDVFIGRHENKIDAKGRMSIPADFRKVLDRGDPERDPGAFPRLLLIIGDERRDYLEGMTVTRGATVRRQIRRMKPQDPRRIDMEDIFYELSVQIAVDETGRIVVPPAAREKLGLSDKALVVGRGETFQIWDPETRLAKRSRPAPAPEIGYDPDEDPMVHLECEEEWE